MRIALMAGLTLLAAGCSEPCVSMREVLVREVYTQDAGMVSIRVVDEDARDDFMGWQISINSIPEAVTAIHLHARPLPGAAVAEIYSFPVEHEQTPFIDIYRSSGGGSYSASLPIDAFLSAMRDTSAYVDFHTASSPVGRSQTRLYTNVREWGEYCF